MTLPFVGEVRLFAGTFAPQGWQFCAGQTLPISGNEELFSLIGTQYGGNGQTTFALPDLQGRTPLSQGVSAASGATYVMGQSGGVELVILTTGQIPAHTHSVVTRGAEGDMSAPSPGKGILANSTFAAALNKVQAYAPYASGGQTTMASGVGPPSYGGQPHDNMQPYVAISYIIATTGIFPARS